MVKGFNLDIYAQQKVLYPPPTGLPSGYTSLDYITIGLEDRIFRDAMVGASDVVYLDHQFTAVPTWSSGTNPEVLYLYSDSYREMRIAYTSSYDYATMVSTSKVAYSYIGYNVGSSNAIESDSITTNRSLLCIPNAAYSLGGVIYPSSVLSPLYINNGVSEDSGAHGVIQSMQCRIYGCYVLDVYDWRHYMVPCERASDGKQGLYDVVDGVFSAILIPNTITNESGTMTATYPVASDLTVALSRGTSSSGTVTFPKGASSVSLGSAYRYYTVSTITPSVDDFYYYVAGVY